CDAPQCRHVLLLVSALYAQFGALIGVSAARIGISFRVSAIDGFERALSTVAKHVPISAWGYSKDYADPLVFMKTLFASTSIQPNSNHNYPLVGLTPALALKTGASGTTAGVPSVDRDIARCTRLLGRQRRSCWVQLDRKLTTAVVPWVPWLWPTTL